MLRSRLSGPLLLLCGGLLTVTLAQPACSSGGSGALGSPPAAGGGTDSGANAGNEVLDPGQVQTVIPKNLPSISNIEVQVVGGSADVRFFPVDGAKDYRIYPLPADADVTNGENGNLTIQNAVYRCSGDRQAEPEGGVVKSAKDPVANTLGYAYPTAGENRLPVYVVASPVIESRGWDESRLKVYTTSSFERDALTAQRWHDRGVAFYVPSPGSGAAPIYTSEQQEIVAGQGWTQYRRFYFGADGLSLHQADTPVHPRVAFSLLQAPQPGSLAVRSVLYSEQHVHTELTVGDAQYQRAINQGNSPFWGLHWSGVEQSSVYVIEALDKGCPYQGFFAPQHLDGSANHQAFLTLEELRANSPTTEVFINGQHEASNLPKAIARAFLKIAPEPIPALDWSDAFETVKPLERVPYNADTGSSRYVSEDYDLTFYRIENHPTNGSLTSFGVALGGFWVAYDDIGSDVTGKVRLTPKAKGAMSDASYLYVTMNVDTVTTGRRYPQLIISSLDAPIQEGLYAAHGQSLFVQPITGPGNSVEVQAIKDFAWDVNNQGVPMVLTGTNNNFVGNYPPQISIFERSAMDRTTRFEVYASTHRVYVFLDGTPLGCANLPDAVAPQGPVTVTFGDVLYHEGAADEGTGAADSPYGFLHAHQYVETKRHFESLGFTSGRAEPTWDLQRLPCVSR